MKKVILPALLLAAFATTADAQSDNRQKMKDAKTRVENITNYNTPQVSTAPVNRIAPRGTQAMTPNAAPRPAGLRTSAVPPPRAQPRPINPSGDWAVRAGATANSVRYQARSAAQQMSTSVQNKYQQVRQAVTRPAQTTTAATRTWPGQARPANTTTTYAAPARSTSTYAAPARSTSTYSTSSSSSSKKK